MDSSDDWCARDLGLEPALFNFLVNDMDSEMEFANDTKLCGSRRKGWHAEEPGQAEEVGLCQLFEVQSGQVQGAALGL